MIYCPTLEQVETAERIVSFLRANPERWNQEEWFDFGFNDDTVIGDHDTSSTAVVLLVQDGCRTAGCMAGWLSADQKLPVFFPTANASYPRVVLPDGTNERLSVWATQRLGLPPFEGSNHMFDEANSIEDLEAWVGFMRVSHDTGEDLQTVVRGAQVAEWPSPARTADHG